MLLGNEKKTPFWSHIITQIANGNPATASALSKHYPSSALCPSKPEQAGSMMETMATRQRADSTALGRTDERMDGWMDGQVVFSGGLAGR